MYSPAVMVTTKAVPVRTPYLIDELRLYRRTNCIVLHGSVCVTQQLVNQQQSPRLIATFHCFYYLYKIS